MSVHLASAGPPLPERLAEDVWFRLASRGAMLLVSLFALPMIWIMGGSFTKMQEQVEANTKAIIALASNVDQQRVLSEMKISEAKATADMRLNMIIERNNLQDNRLMRIEQDIYRINPQLLPPR